MKICKKCGSCRFYKGGDCAECSKLRVKEWAKSNTERDKERKHKWDLENAATRCAKKRLARINNPKGASAAEAKWKKLNHEKVKLFRKLHDSRRRSAGGKLSKDIVGRLIILQKNKCPCCDMPLGNDFHLDHILPIALGGTNEDNNIQLLRKSCNLKKNAKHPIRFMQERGFLL